MHSDRRTEHYVTLFDSAFLPLGITLHDSLMTHGQPFHLWILCMDALAEEQLRGISLPCVTTISLGEIENGRLLEIKPGRTRREYCWTLTPFTFSAVFDKDAAIDRVTYLDADLFFFDRPDILLSEMNAAGRHVLITEHAYSPQYSMYLNRSGRFCVQFLTFRRTPEAETVMRWWQERCLEWCFDRVEDGKFGDQKYLDRWPELFADKIHIVQHTEKTLAPWNVRFIEERSQGKLEPVFYHFQGLRIISPKRVWLYDSYDIAKEGIRLYEAYCTALRGSIRKLDEAGIAVPHIRLSLLETIRRSVLKSRRIVRIA